MIISDFFVEPEELRSCFEHLRFRKHDIAAFHLLDPLELEFTFRRPMRFFDMEGGAAVFAEPNEIADRYHTVLRKYLDSVKANRPRIGDRLSPRAHRRRLRTNVDAIPRRPHPWRRKAMSFLQPLLLAALPLIALPVIIHLINQRRYQTIHWAAMMFLLAANRMSRGYARLRQWLILAFRMLVIAGLVFAVSRPLASGWLGLAAGGRPDTTLVLLDRSPSMQQAVAGGTASKCEAGIQQLVSTLSTLGSKHWVVIDSVSCKPIELESPAALLNSASASGASSSADVPAMLQAAYDYLQANRAGQTDIWICSDLRANDWNAQSGRWPSLREGFGEFKQTVRFHLLADTRAAPSDLSVRVTGVRREATARGGKFIGLAPLVREQGDDAKVTIPLQFEIDGARSELSVDMTGAEFDLKDHPIPLAANQKRGWGHVSIPADVNPADNDFYFVYDEPPPRHTIIVADDPQAVHAQQLAAEITGDPAVEGNVGSGRLGRSQ